MNHRVSNFQLPMALLLLLGGGLTLPTNAAPPAVPKATTEFEYAHDHIIGTSLDLRIVAPTEKSALAAEGAILDEIERLRKIFSTYDSSTELSRWNTAPIGAFAASPELIEVLKLYEVWQERSGGAFHGRVGLLVNLWQKAEKDGVKPSADTLRAIREEMAQPGWIIDEKAKTVTRRDKAVINLNAIAKGYIIQKSMDAARKAVPEVSGLLINLGGDIAVWGKTGAGAAEWAIGVQNPNEPAANAALHTAVKLKGQAIATSGGYQRYYTIEGKKYSHILDPRTGESTGHVAGATVIASDNATANALATTLCVLTPEEGLKLVGNTPGAECLIVDRKGEAFRSAGFAKFEIELPKQPASTEKCDGDPWVEGNQVTINVELPNISDAKPRYRRPYVAIWIEDKDGKPVRTISVWGNSGKYLKDLGTWWKFAKEDQALVKAVTRATRQPGKYEVIWDGKNDAGKMVAQGTYTVKVEVHREHGKHLTQTGKIDCAKEDAKATLEKNAETEATEIVFGAKKKK